MSSDKGISVYLEDNDKELFDKAVKLYGMGKSELLKEIIHSWLFNNKLQFTKKEKCGV